MLGTVIKIIAAAIKIIEFDMDLDGGRCFPSVSFVLDLLHAHPKDLRPEG